MNNTNLHIVRKRSKFNLYFFFLLSQKASFIGVDKDPLSPTNVRFIQSFFNPFLKYSTYRRLYKTTWCCDLR